jgi:hypothetical protein
MRLRTRERGWSSTQTRLSDGAVESVQRMTFPRPVVELSQDGARRLGDLYWKELRRATIGLIRTTQCDLGLEVRVLGRGPALLRFGVPDYAIDASAVHCSYAIQGGLLARSPGGSIRFTQKAVGVGAVVVTSAVVGFLPRLGVLYAPVQSRLHVALGGRYFSRLRREAPQ